MALPLAGARVRASDWLAIEDTGWVNVTVAGGFGTQETIQVRRIGSMAYARGGWSNTGIAISTTYANIGTIPAGYRPSGALIFRAGTSNGASAASFFIQTDGTVGLRTNGTLSGYYFWNGHSWLVD